jgi:hypothetical protein
LVLQGCFTNYPVLGGLRYILIAHNIRIPIDQTAQWYGIGAGYLRLAMAGGWVCDITENTASLNYLQNHETSTSLDTFSHKNIDMVMKYGFDNLII